MDAALPASRAALPATRDASRVLILGCAALAVAVAAAAQWQPHALAMLVLADLWLLGYHHVFATFTKLAGTRQDRERNAVLVWLVVPVFATTFALGLAFGTAAIVTLYFLWQWFHYVRQSWGISQRYRGSPPPGLPGHPGWCQAVLWSVPVWGLLNRCHQQPETFLWMPIRLPAPPSWLVQAAGVACAVLVAAWAYTQAVAWLRGQLVKRHAQYMLTHFAIFSAGYVFIDDLTTGWLMVNVWHNAQYLVFVWMHNRQRFAAPLPAGGPLLAWLSQPGAARATLYFGACLLASTVFYAAVFLGASVATPYASGGAADPARLSIVVLVAMTLNFHHYVVDGLIWKRKRQVRP